MKDKDLRAMTRVLFPAASTVVLTRVPYKRSATPEDLLAAAPPFKGRVLLEPDTRKAVELALVESKRRIARRHRRLALPYRRSQAARRYSVTENGDTYRRYMCPLARQPVPSWGSPFRQLHFRGLRAKVSSTFPPGKVA